MHVRAERQPLGQVSDRTVGPRDGSEARTRISQLAGLLGELLGHWVRPRPTRQALLQVPENAYTAGVHVTPVEEGDLGGHDRQYLGQKLDDSSRRDAAGINDQAAVLDLTDLPIEARIVLDRQDRPCR